MVCFEMKADQVATRKCPTAEIWWVMRGDTKVGEVKRYHDGFRVSILGTTEEACRSKGKALARASELAARLDSPIVEIIGLMNEMSDEGLKQLYLRAKEVAREYPKLPPAKVIQFPVRS